MVRGSNSREDTQEARGSRIMSSKYPEKETWRFYFHRDIDKLSDIVRDYMTNYNAEYETDGMDEVYTGQISDIIQGLTQSVLDDLIQLWGNKGYSKNAWY